MARQKRLIGVFDTETDPFIVDQYPAPFASCLYFAEKEYWLVWGDDTIEKIADIMETLPPCDVYAHNGGKFDFHFLLHRANRGQIKIINGRIAVMYIGNVRLIDSMLLIPFGLATYKKTEIDYNKFLAEHRENHKQEIVDYLLDDCRDLLELVSGFHSRLGKKLTIGSAAIDMVKRSGVKIERQNEAHDKVFRNYYYGGRVEAIKPGVHRGEFKMYDINSAYPAAMMLKHPIGNKKEYTIGTTMPKLKALGPQFITLRGIARGSLPFKKDDGGLSFPRDELAREYSVTGWEVAAGLETGALEIQDILEVWTPNRTQSFSAFVLNTYAARMKAKAAGEKLDELVYKVCLNSAYGKFCTNPENFADWEISEPGILLDGFELYAEGPGVWIHRRPATEQERQHGYFDVAIGASITGAVRAQLWRSLCAVQEPFYCDTDSIICRDAGSLELDENKLGAFKFEMSGYELAIAGKKLYAMRSRDLGKNGEEKKKIASKGARLTVDDIFEIARGKVKRWENFAPTYSIKRGAHFVKRDIRGTSAG